MTADEINSLLRGYTLVTFMHMEFEDGAYTLVLRLAKELADGSPVVEVLFDAVGDLNVLDFGGGLSQFLYLQASDESDHGLENIKYRIGELEQDAIRFTCAAIRILPST